MHLHHQLNDFHSYFVIFLILQIDLIFTSLTRYFAQNFIVAKSQLKHFSTKDSANNNWLVISAYVTRNIVVILALR